MADDDFNFDFENSLEPPHSNQQVSPDLTQVLADVTTRLAAPAA